MYTKQMELLIPGRDRGYLDGDSFDYRGPLAFTLPAVMTGSPASFATWMP